MVQLHWKIFSTHKWDSNRLIPKFSRAKEGPFPYLFILAMEALSQILLRVREGGFISGFKVSGGGSNWQEMIHLLYTNNTLVFYDTRQDHLEDLSWSLIL